MTSKKRNYDNKEHTRTFFIVTYGHIHSNMLRLKALTQMRHQYDTTQSSRKN